jgi:DNA-binding response OmpR family regulator
LLLEIEAVSYTNTPVLNYLPTLVVDANGPAATQLAVQLSHSGFSADIAITCSAALAAARARHYGSLVFIADVNEAADLACVGALRKRSPRTWIIVISSTAPSEAQKRVLRYDADALLIAPFAMKDLTSRLLAFSLRSRPP